MFHRFAIITLLLVLPATAQTLYNTGDWNQLTLSHRYKQGNMGAELHWRHQQLYSVRSLYMVRPYWGLRVGADDELRLQASYHDHQYTAPDGQVRQWREVNLRQAFFFNRVQGPWLYTQRLQTEQRWIETQPDSWLYRNRAWLRAQVQRSLCREAQQPGAVYLTAYAELAANWGGNALFPFDQSRLNATAGLQLSKAVRLDVGWMWQYQQKTRTQYLSNQLLMTHLRIQL